MSLADIKADITAKLPEWREEYEKLGKYIAAAEALVGETALSDTDLPDGEPKPTRAHHPTSQRRPIASDEFVGMSTSQAVKAFLTHMGKGNPQGPRDMAKALVAGGQASDEEKAYANVQSVLKRMNKAEEIKQVRRGQWGLAAWYGPPTPMK